MTPVRAPAPVAPTPSAGGTGRDPDRGAAGDRTPSSAPASLKASLRGGYGRQDAAWGESFIAAGRDARRAAPLVETTTTASQTIERALEAYDKQTAALKAYNAALQETPGGRRAGGLDLNRLGVDLIV